MNQIPALDGSTASELAQLEYLLSHDMGGDHASAMLSYFDAVRVSCERKLAAPLPDAERVYLTGLTEAFRAAQRTVRHVWEHYHAREYPDLTCPGSTPRQVLRGTTPEQHRDYPTVCRNLMAVGLLAAVHRCSAEAELIHAVVESTIATPGTYRLVRAMTLAMAGDATYAVTLAEALLSVDPDDAMAKVLSGYARRLAGDPGWQFNLDNVLATSSDARARLAATAVIDDDFFKTLEPLATRFGPRAGRLAIDPAPTAK
jgi:hypothetical protein